MASIFVSFHNSFLLSSLRHYFFLPKTTANFAQEQKLTNSRRHTFSPFGSFVWFHNEKLSCCFVDWCFAAKDGSTGLQNTQSNAEGKQTWLGGGNAVARLHRVVVAVAAGVAVVTRAVAVVAVAVGGAAADCS